MYLKEIKSQGFKSFADNITIELSNGTTGIVGPNGSGKSNIVDAVRWVLGEQSVKSLRGDNNMTDVIFSGSKSRKASGTASVTLIFDNTDRYLKIDSDTISIRRKIYNDGTNEYYLNNEKCRLKDVSDILLDSGIAKESFNIISQGKIDDIISSKSTDRRVIFEEAAGVLKYKKRKEDALKKLDKTHDNIERANDIINELEIQVSPLKKQKEKAVKYLEYNEQLKNIEIALMAFDITNLNDKLISAKNKIEILNNELLELSNTGSTSSIKITKLKIQITKLEEEISEKQKELILRTANVEKINSQKQILLERKSYEVDDIKLHNNLIELKERKLKFQNSIKKLESNIEINNNLLQKIDIKILDKKEEIQKNSNTKLSLNNNLTKLIKINNNLKIKIDSLNENIDNNEILPYAVKQILNRNGVHNVLGKLIEINDEYNLCISVALASVCNFVVVDNELYAKEIINYLKQAKIGRVTFLPINIIKPKTIDISSMDLIKKAEGYVDIASNLVKYDKMYENIVKNFLGNVIVVKNIDCANRISKLISNKYKVVTLSGEVINVGGSITGGIINNTNIINIKKTLDCYIAEYNDNLNEIKRLENNINELDYNLKSLEDELYLNNKEKIDINLLIENTLKEIESNKEELEFIINNISSTDSMLNNTISEEEEKIINNYYEEVSLKENVESKLSELKNEIYNLKEQLENIEHVSKQDNTIYNTKSKELKNLEIEANRYDVKLDMLLNSLSENYTITYEKAKNDYILLDDEMTSRGKVNNLKQKIKELGPVNINAIEEYDKVSQRYEFLINQREDLIVSENTLVDIINQLDEVMIKDFTNYFNEIRDNFNLTFKELFKGGYADLKLSSPDDILNTGIEIIASPPGKKLTTISLLSGGEKTFTAISLLFAIVKTRQVPFCILDEVEAALDEANVASFGEYINNLKQKTQFILITHKKKTMEFVDVLYGITMQESGVSKLVSVKLEEMGDRK